MGSALEDIVRYGTVDSVNVAERTARVRFEDKNNMVSGPLVVLQNQPTIVVQKKESEVKWDYEAEYATADRKLGLGESYSKSTPDTIKLTKDSKEEIIEIHPWLPFIGQMVACLYLPHGESDGFIIGGT